MRAVCNLQCVQHFDVKRTEEWKNVCHLHQNDVKLIEAGETTLAALYVQNVKKLTCMFYMDIGYLHFY